MPQFHVILDNSYEAVCDNCYTDLYADGIFCCTPESLNLKVLLEAFQIKTLYGFGGYIDYDHNIKRESMIEQK